MKIFIMKVMNRVFRLFDYSVVPSQNLLLTYQHDYGPDAYETYKKVQIFHNKQKIDQVWADEDTLKVIADYIKENIENVSGGICHGTRRGYEQEKFAELLDCSVVGTEISDTADQFANTVQWDFHNQKPEWVGGFSFVYSNSLDQAFDPKKALSAWAAQLEPEGLMFLEYTMVHSPKDASEMDPFGAHPMVMPYLIFQWGMNEYQLADILEMSHPEKRKIWIFVIRQSGPVPSKQRKT